MKKPLITKMMSIAMLGLTLASPGPVKAQDNNATIISPLFGDLLRSATFGESVFNKNGLLFVVDRQYRSDGKNANGCNIGYGAVFVYKKTNGAWTRTQKLKHIGGINQSGTEIAENTTASGNTASLSTYKWNSLENGFAESGLDAAGNLFVVGVPREDYNRWGPNTKTHAGAIYLYRRATSTANYSLVKTVFDPNPSTQTRFAGGGVSVTDGGYFVAATQIPGGTSYLTLFRITENNVNTVGGRINLNTTWQEPAIKGTTDNRVIVLTAKVNGINTVNLYRIINGSIQPFFTPSVFNFSGYEIQDDGVSVNSNSVVVHYKETATGKPKLRIHNIRSEGSISSYEVVIPEDLSSKTIYGKTAWINPENSSSTTDRAVAVTFKDPASIDLPVVAYFKFNSSTLKYEYKTKLSLPAQYASEASFAYGNHLLLTSTEVIISDSFNRTFDSPDDGTNQQCSEYKSSGLVFLHNRSNFEAGGSSGFRFGEESSDLYQTLAPNPVEGSFVELISSEQALQVMATNTAGKDIELGVSENRISVAELQAGLYILKITTASGISFKKLQVK